MKKLFPIIFALSVIAGPSLAWGWGEGGCSYSKDKSNEDANKTEEVKETDAQSVCANPYLCFFWKYFLGSDFEK